MTRKAGRTVIVKSSKTERERTPLSGICSCQLSGIKVSRRQAHNTSRPESPNDASRTELLARRDPNHQDQHTRRISDTTSGSASPEWHNIHPESPKAKSPTGNHSDDVYQSTDSENESFVLVNNTRGSRRRQYTRKCPFFTRDPNKHVRCGRFDLSPGYALTDHLFQCHLHLPVCYRCGSMFNSVARRNAHAVSGECDLVEPPPTFEGVGEGTIYELEALVSSWNQGVGRPLSDEEKYARIWEVVFPGE